MINRRKKYLDQSIALYQNWKRFFRAAGTPEQKKIFQAIVVEYFDKSVQLQTSPKITIPKGSVRARIPGIDFDVQDSDLRIFYPQTSHAIERYIKGDLINVIFQDTESLNNGTIIGKALDDKLHVESYVEKYKGNWSDNVVLGTIMVGKPISNPVFYYNKDYHKGSSIGTFPSLWPVSNNIKKAERYLNGLKIHIDEIATVISSGGGIITLVEGNKIIIKHDKNFVTVYDNLLSESYKDFSEIEEGKYVSEGMPIAKTNPPYFYFEIVSDSIYLDPLRYIAINDVNSKQNLYEITNPTLYYSTVQL